MSKNISFQQLPDGFAASLLSMDEYLRSRPLDPALRTLVATRVSQLNKCAFCIDMHWREAEKRGHEPHRLALLPAHRSLASEPGGGGEFVSFSPSEAAALRLADALTDLSEQADLGAAWKQAERYFEREEVADLCLAIAETNAWNRIARACGFAIRAPQTR